MKKLLKSGKMTQIIEERSAARGRRAIKKAENSRIDGGAIKTN